MEPRSVNMPINPDPTCNPFAPNSGLTNEEQYKFKGTEWFDLKQIRTLYGILIHVDGKWMNCTDGDKPMLYPNKNDRDQQLKKLRKK